MVAETFIPNPHNLPEINHIDGNKLHNNKDNLEWCSRKYNERAARRLLIKSYKPFVVRFKDGTVKYYEFTPQLAREIGVSKGTILNYLHHRSNGYFKNNIIYIKYLNE